MYRKPNGTIEGYGWWIYLLSALIKGNAEDIIRARNENFFLVPEPSFDYKSALKVGLSGLISVLRQLARTGLPAHRQRQEGDHEYALNHHLLGQISYRWSTDEASFWLKAEGRPILTAQRVTRQSASVRWHFDDPLRATVEHIINCPTGEHVDSWAVVDGGIAISRPEEGEHWLPLLEQLWRGDAEGILASRNVSPFLLPDDEHAHRLTQLAGHRGFIRLFDHIAKSWHPEFESLPLVQQYTCFHRGVGHLRWRRGFVPYSSFELDVDETPLLKSVNRDGDHWEVSWLFDTRLAPNVEQLLSCATVRECRPEWAW